MKFFKAEDTLHTRSFSICRKALLESFFTLKNVKSEICIFGQKHSNLTYVSLKGQIKYLNKSFTHILLSISSQGMNMIAAYVTNAQMRRQAIRSIVFFAIKDFVALDRSPGPGYNTLLLQLIPGDLLPVSACPYRQLGCTVKLLP